MDFIDRSKMKLEVLYMTRKTWAVQHCKETNNTLHNKETESCTYNIKMKLTALHMTKTKKTKPLKKLMVLS